LRVLKKKINNSCVFVKPKLEREMVGEAIESQQGV